MYVQLAGLSPISAIWNMGESKAPINTYIISILIARFGRGDEKFPSPKAHKGSNMEVL